MYFQKCEEYKVNEWNLYEKHKKHAESMTLEWVISQWRRERISWQTPQLSIIFITMVTCIFLLLEVSAFEIKVKASLAVLVFLMKKQNLGSSTMHIISRDQS